MTAMEQLKWNLGERHGSVRFFTDGELLELLEQNEGNVRRASYEGLLRKAQSDGVTLPDGTKTADARSYWLSLARQFRPCDSGLFTRADEGVR